MKRVAFWFILFLMLFGTRAFAEEETYLVWLNEPADVRLFSVAEKKYPSSDFAVLTASELQASLEAGLVGKYVPNVEVELYAQDWNLQAIQTAFPQSVGCTGTGVTVAVIDSGVQEIGVLEGRLLTGYNYVAGSTDTTDDLGHGTFVCGIVAGAAPGCSILPLKAFQGTNTSLEYIVAAIDAAVEEYDVDVINMSFGIGKNIDESVLLAVQDTLNESIQKAIAQGIIVIAAAGNDGESLICYPAGCTDVIGVGAVNSENARWASSQYNETVFVVAPGEDVVSTAISDYTVNDGTSFAAPHVAALAAVAKSIDPTLKVDGFKTLLQATSTDLGEAGYDVYFGHGLINCRALVQAMLQEGSLLQLSDILLQEETSSVTVYNNTASQLSLWCIYACYDDGGALTGLAPEEISIAAGQTHVATKPYTAGQVQYMVWSKAYTVPLTAPARK